MESEVRTHALLSRMEAMNNLDSAHLYEIEL